MRLPRVAAAAGTIRVLTDRAIGVDGEHDLTCKLTDASPDVDGLEVGDKVSIVCADGVLVKVGRPSAEHEVTTAAGAITALGDASITVQGERKLTCRLTNDSPIPDQFKVGDQVGIACVDGVVVKIARLPQASAPKPEGTGTGTTTAPTSTTVTLVGTVTALGSGSISIHGERDLTCKLTDGSPKTGEFKVGDKVKVACTNGVLTGIARTDSTPTTTTPTTTTGDKTPVDDADDARVDHGDRRHLDHHPRRSRRDLHARRVLAEARRLPRRRQGQDGLHERRPHRDHEDRLAASAASSAASDDDHHDHGADDGLGRGLDRRPQRELDHGARRPRDDLHARRVLAQARRLPRRRQGEDRLHERRAGRNRQNFVRLPFHRPGAVVASERALCRDRIDSCSRPRDGRIATADAPKRASIAGTISVLKLKTITVHGKGKLECRLATTSPRLRGFALGTNAKITCVRGVLATIKKLAVTTTPAGTLQPGGSGVKQEDTITVTPDKGGGTVGPFGQARAKTGLSVVGTSTITALGGGSITFAGSLTCTVNASSPSVAGFHVGERVDYQCANGVLTKISAAFD